MPKQRITREIVVNAAFELARTGGMDHVLVKTIAERLGCSVQPIYSYCKNMDELRRDIERQAKAYIQDYLAAHIDKPGIYSDRQEGATLISDVYTAAKGGNFFSKRAVSGRNPS